MGDNAAKILKTEKKDGIFWITLARPEKRNAINLEILEALGDAADEAAKDKETRIVALRGEGAGFSAGIDLTLFPQIAQLGGHIQFRVVQGRMQGILNRIESIEKPVLCMIHGFCYGLGLEIALAADFRIAEKGAKLGLQEVEIGLVPDVGGTTRLTRLVGIGKAKEIIMMGRKIPAEQALDIHLVNEIVDEGRLEAAAARWAEEAKGCAPLAVGLAKRMIDLGATLDRHAFLEIEGIAQSSLIGTKDMQEGAMAKLQKRPPEFKGQ